MRLRTAMPVSVLALVALIVGAVLFAIQRTVERGARDDVQRGVDQGKFAIDPIARALTDRAAVEAHVTAIQPRLLALMATDAETIQDQAEDFRTALGASSLTITDPARARSSATRARRPRRSTCAARSTRAAPTRSRRRPTARPSS